MYQLYAAYPGDVKPSKVLVLSGTSQELDKSNSTIEASFFG
jgi:hypothetical protein